MTMPSSIHRKFHGQISYTCNRFVCAANLSRVACKAQRSASSQRSRQPVLVYFTEEDKPVEAFSGESFTQARLLALVPFYLLLNHHEQTTRHHVSHTDTSRWQSVQGSAFHWDAIRGIAG